jgi:[protein-PII] uridylyltransferase
MLPIFLPPYRPISLEYSPGSGLAYPIMVSSPVPNKSIEFQLDLNATHRRDFVAECNALLNDARLRQAGLILAREGRKAAKAFSDDVDLVLFRVLDWLIEEARLSPADYERITIIAQGGYGRAQMNPFSDIDLLFVIPDSPRPVEQAFLKSFLYILWDLNKVELGHATHRLAEVLEPVGQDLDSTTALTQLRLLRGQPGVLAEIEKRVAKQVRGPSRRWFVESKIAESRNRKEKYGRSIYLLEPNVKEGEGGLRDIHSLIWLSYALLNSADLDVLVARNILATEELQSLYTAMDFLLSIRTSLHLNEKRKADVLAFDKQPVVAQQLGYKSDPQLLAEEKMMKDYYRHARVIDRYSQKAIRLMNAKSPGRVGGVFDAMRRHSLNEFYFIKNGLLFLKDENPAFFRDKPSRIMEAFWIGLTTGTDLSEELKASLEQNHNVADTEAFRTSPDCRNIFMQILGQRKGAATALHQMHETGVLADYMPEFRKLFCLVRIDHYHRYTVDEHLIKTIYEVEDLYQTGAGQRPELVDEARKIQRWDLLTLSLLLHDIGKGEGHGHVLRGAILSQKMTERMGLDPDEQEVVRQLILQHLKMVHMSQRRDLEDPNVIAEMAGTVPDIDLLRMLYVLTYCDTRAVGPTAWTDWKGLLLYELFRKTVLFLEGKDPIRHMDESAREALAHRLDEAAQGNEPQAKIRSFINNAPEKYLATVPPQKMVRHMTMLHKLDDETRAVWHVDEPSSVNYTEISVVAQDVRGLLSYLCGALSSKDINILSLQAFSTKDGYAMDVFQVTDLHGNKLPHGFRLDRIKNELNQVLAKKKTAAEAFPIRRRNTGMRDVAVVKPAQIIVDNDGSPDFTILEVKAYDRPGLLYDVTSTCNEQNYYIHLAMITTEAYRVVDVFYITDLEFNKLDMNQTKKLRIALEAQVI